MGRDEITHRDALRRLESAGVSAWTWARMREIADAIEFAGNKLCFVEPDPREWRALLDCLTEVIAAEWAAMLPDDLAESA
jgi:hypothetical protein